jgi:addiction module RelE/StbE family toxin
MVKVVWTDFAIRDLNDIGEYIAKDSERYAKVVIQNLFESTDLLESHPKAGRIVPEFNNKNLRELIRGSYRIVYRIVDIYRIDILTVHHSTRLLTKSTLYKRKK